LKLWFRKQNRRNQCITTTEPVGNSLKVSAEEEAIPEGSLNEQKGISALKKPRTYL